MIIKILKHNDVHVRVDCETSVAQELSDYFTFNIPGAYFMPAFRSRVWDGKIRLFNAYTGIIYKGLVPYICKFAKDRKYNIEKKLEYDFLEKVDLNDVADFIDNLKLYDQDPDGKYIPIKLFEHQLSSIIYSIQNSRCLILSPTGSGKSLIIYVLMRFYQHFLFGFGKKFNEKDYVGQIEKIDKKILLIVPTISLVHQMFTNFADYAYKDKTWDVNLNCHMIYEGQKKETDKPIVISTWQSVYKMPKKWFSKFYVVFGDECHQYKANSLKSIMHKLENCPYRIGTTGTIDDTKTHKLIIEGLFGAIYHSVSTKELIEKQQLATLKIKCLVLKYPELVCKENKKTDYHGELDFIVSHPGRNRFIRNLALKLEGNTLLLFRYVKKHGRIIYDLIKEKSAKNRKIFFVYGGTDAETRESVRRITEKENDAIIVASIGVFSIGINIRRLHNIIFASPSKSRIQVFQSIGRALRKAKHKDEATLYDIADNLSYKKHQNYTIKHFLKRIEYYNAEQFPYKIYEVELK